jgi:hypothetical protein
MYLHNYLSIWYLYERDCYLHFADEEMGPVWFGNMPLGVEMYVTHSLNHCAPFIACLGEER